MNKSKTIILTGPVQTGKTTFLKNIFDSRTDCGGFLTPDQSGKRVLYRLDDKSIHEFEVENTENEHFINIGRFFFNHEAFTLGHKLIAGSLKKNYTHFIIDEIGKLELKNEGFDNALTDIFWENISKKNTLLILVVRDYLIDDVINKYKINSPTIFNIQEPHIRDKFIAACGL